MAFIEIEKDGAVGRCHPHALPVWEEKGWSKTAHQKEKEAAPVPVETAQVSNGEKTVAAAEVDPNASSAAATPKDVKL